jgi:glutamine synthetase
VAKAIKNLIASARRSGVEMVDLKFSNLLGGWHHLSLPVSQLNEALFKYGEGFDGSSIPGFKQLEAGDLVLLPDPSTALIDTFWDQKTMSFICDVADPKTLQKYERDPRYVAEKAENYLRKTGIADESLWGPEFEFYIFNHINYKNDINIAYHKIDSDEADWNTGADKEENLGYKIPRKGGYHAIPPLDTLFNVRAEMVRNIEEAGVPVRYHHHEVGGPGQSEIEIRLNSLRKAGDVSMLCKYIIKMTAKRHNKTVTFMPKPLYNEAGSGMHFHQLLKKKGKPIFYDKNGYAGLSQIARWYIGGILTHGPALLGLTNPSTNSYKRLVPGFEAPVKLFYGLANRSAAIRIPKYANAPHEKRFEFRPPDATCNIYLALAAQLMAGIDGIKRKIDPTEAGFGPIDANVFELPEKERNKIRSLPSSLEEALEALRKDHQFLLEGGVFTEDMIHAWIDYKMNHEYNEVRNRPHPYEMSLYFDV